MVDANVDTVHRRAPVALMYTSLNNVPKVPFGREEPVVHSVDSPRAHPGGPARGISVGSLRAVSVGIKRL